MKLSGIKILDAQHAGLLDAVAKLKALQNTPNEFSASLSFLFQLMTYAVEHFRTEEAILRAQNYQDLQHQLDEHAYFAKVVEHYKQTVVTQQVIPEEMLNFIERWLVEHIDAEAVEYQTHLRSR